MIKIFFHNIPDDTRYAFAVAKIRALESKMLDQSMITRLLKSNGTQELLKILTDTEYGQTLNETKQGPFESVLDKELNRIYLIINTIDPDTRLTDLWRWRYDAHNIKVVLKSGLLKKNGASEHLIPFGIIKLQDLIKSLQEGTYDCFPLPFKEAIEIIQPGEDDKIKGMGEIDTIIDRALYRYLYEEAEKSKNHFLLHLVEMLIDFINIDSFIRIKSIKESSKELFHRSFLPKGKLSKDCFVSTEGDINESVRTLLENTPYEDLLPYLDSKNLALLETGMENFLIAYIRQTRQRVFGVEPLIGYMFGKEIEIKNLRLLYVGIANGLEEQQIKKRLRDTYV